MREEKRKTRVYFGRDWIYQDGYVFKLWIGAREDLAAEFEMVPCWFSFAMRFQSPVRIIRTEWRWPIIGFARSDRKLIREREANGVPQPDFLYTPWPGRIPHPTTQDRKSG
jgi:hypothetical protein